MDMKKNSVLEFDHETEYYAVLIRSKRCGVLFGIDVPELPEGVYFFSAKDVPNKNEFSAFECSIPVFADEIIAYYGQPVGILAGKNKDVLYALQEQITVQVESGQHNEVSVFDYTEGTIPDTFEGTHICVRSQFSEAVRHPYNGEPDSVYIEYRPDNISVHVVTQWSTLVQSAVENITGIAKKKIHVFDYNSAESLDMHIWFPALISAQVAVAAALLKASVFLRFSSYEQVHATPKTPRIHITHTATLAQDSTVAAMDIDICVRTGAFHPLLAQHVKQMVNTAAGIYGFPHCRVHVCAYSTFPVLAGLAKGWGDAYTTNALEKHINDIARICSYDPVDYRLQNITRVQKKHALESCSYVKEFSPLFNAALRSSDFRRKHAAYFLLNSATSGYKGAWRGIGFAAGLQYNGIQHMPTGISSYTVSVTLETDNTVYIETNVLTENVRKILRNLVATELEIEKNKIMFKPDVNYSSGQAGLMSSSVSVALIPALIKKCCARIQKQRFRQPLPLTARQVYKRKANSTLSADESKIFFSTTPAVCVVELEVNPIVYNVHVRKIWLGCNPGKIYVNRFIKSHLRKSLEQVFSRLCCEKISVGQKCDTPVQAANYTLLPASKLPHLDLLLSGEGRVSRGIGEIPENLVTAAYLSALNQVFVGMGRTIEQTPVYIDDIFKAFRVQE